MQIGEKKSQLNEDSALYSHETDKLTEKEKLSAMTRQQKWAYFKDYYLLKIIAGIAILAFVVSLAYSIFKPKTEMVFYAAIGDYSIPLEIVDKVSDDFSKYIAIDPDKQEICLDTSYSFSTDSYNAIQKFAVYLAVGQINVAVIPESSFKTMAPNGYFVPMSEVLSTELYIEFSDRFVMSGINDDNGVLIADSEKAYGIQINDCDYLKDYGFREPIVVCVCANNKNNAACVDFIEFLLK